MFPNRIPPFPGRSKDNALLDNITICGRVVGDFEKVCGVSVNQMV